MQRIETIIYILICLAVGSINAQTINLLERDNEALSPSESRHNINMRDLDAKQQKELYENPSYCEWTHTHDSLFMRNRYRNIVYTGYGMGEQEGDFLTYEGNGSYDYRLGASGEYSIKNAGVLFGSIQYALGEHKNIGWNAMRYPELYLPYISTDSIGGDYKYEDYQISGGYGFTIENWKLGVNGAFHGEQAHRKTDPRALNKTTWFNIGVGTSTMVNGHLFMLNGTFQRNKQHMNLRYWRPGQQDRFFVSYGFGQYDIRRSLVAFGYSRMYYITEGNARFTYQSPQDKKVSLYASFAYEYDHMKTEESDICDLYHSKTHTLKPTIKLDYRPDKRWELTLWLEGDIDLRKGYENIFERYQSDEDNFIYDYRLIDTQQEYVYNKTYALGQLRVRCRINKSHTLGLLGGAAYNDRDERYKVMNYKIRNSSIFPHAKLYYNMMVRRSELDVSLMYGKKINLSNTYEVAMNNTTVQHLDFQHAFTPYAYHNSSYQNISAALTYVYHFKKCALGVNGKIMYTDGARDANAIFTGTIGYDSTAPKISTTPDKHRELWGSASIFVTF